MVDCPIPLNKYPIKPNRPVSLPAEFPDHWNEDNNRTTVGNSTLAHLGTSPQVFAGASQNNLIIFDPAEPTGDDQKILNIFYYNCYMHDYFYLLGFREEDGNFQHDNLGRGGGGTDRVDARSHSAEVNGTANMFTPVDGVSPVMNMGLVSDTDRHTDF